MHAAPSIRRLRVRETRQPAPSDRLQLQRDVEQLALDCPDVAPAAILIVRRLVVGAARARCGGVNVRGDDAVSRLRELYRRAVRPADANVPDDAEAVLFRDSAELIACLVEDRLAGRASGRWWWTVVLRSSPELRAAALPELWRDNPRELPAVVATLARRGLLRPAARRLSSAHAVEIAAQVAREHGLSAGLVEAVAPAAGPAGSTARVASRSAVAVEPDRETAARAAARREPELVPSPWSAATEEIVDRSLPPAVRCLIAILHELDVRPQVVRSAAFVEAVRRFVARRSGPHHSGDVAERVHEPAVDLAAAAPADVDTPTGVSGGAGRETGAAGSEARSRRLGREPASPRTELPPDPQPAARDRPRRPAARPVRPRGTPASDHPDVVEIVPAEHHEDAADGVRTSLGGVLYLVNALDGLGLLTDFEADWGLVDRLGAWGVVDLVARTLLGDDGELRVRDPIWRSLATLAGRESDEPPGRGLRTPDRFVLPPRAVAALAPEDEADLSFGVRDRRLRLQAGPVVLADCPLEDGLPASRQARALLRDDLAMRPAELRRSTAVPVSRPLLWPPCEAPDPGAQRFCDLVSPWLAARLEGALAPCGLTDVLATTGTLYVTRTHVDLVCPIDAVSIGARVAGLDRTPGWVPALSRIVTFHFE